MNQIKIIKLDDTSLKAINELTKQLSWFRNDLKPLLDLLDKALKFELTELPDDELTALVNGEEYEV